MRVPFEITTLGGPRNKENNPRKIFLLYEGAVTEKLLIDPLTSKGSPFSSDFATFFRIDKTLNDKGITDPLSLMKIANEFPTSDLGKRYDFDLNYDKVLIVCDLDVYKNDQDKINNLIAIKKDYIILACTNPAIELFFLLFKEGSFENIIKPFEKEIIDNNFIDDKHKKRFIYDLVLKEMKINIKKPNIKIRDIIIENIDIAKEQELKLNNKLTKAANTLTSNVIYALNKIKENKIDEIEY